jgi:hypothetical protein
MPPAPEPGKDAFHRVPLIAAKVRDAVEPVLTRFRDTDLAAHLPAFFCTLFSQKPTREHKEKLLGIITGTRRP